MNFSELQQHGESKSHSLIKAILVILIIFMAVLPAYTQVILDTGLEPYHTYQNGNIDHINLDNGSLTLTIPLVSYPQRGQRLKMSFGLVYFTPWTASITQCVNAANGTGGTGRSGSGGEVRSCNATWNIAGTNTFNLLPTGGGVALVDLQDVKQTLTSVPMITDAEVPPDCEAGACGAISPAVTPEGGYTSQTVWLTADGGQHPAGQMSNGQIALDGSGFQNGITYALSTTSNQGTPNCHWLCSLPGLIAVKDGVTYYSAGNGPSTENGNILREDADGNYITRSSTEYVDTTGREIPLPTVVSSPTSSQIASCGGPLPITQIVTWSPPGYSAPFLFCYANVIVSLPWSTADTPGSSSYGITSHPGPFLQNVVLPNQQVWTFQYGESFTPYQGQQAVLSNINLGDLTEVAFPTGGTLSYSYSPTTTQIYPRMVQF